MGLITSSCATTLMSSRPILSLRLLKVTKDNLLRAGYETLKDIIAVSAESLSHDLNITIQEANDILQQVQNPPTQHPNIPATQSASNMVTAARRFTTGWPGLDKLLHGGLLRGHILEISGPPGSPKEQIAIDITRSILEAGDEVLFIDCQNMNPPSKLYERLTASLSKSLHYSKISTATEMMTFLYSAQSILQSMPKVSLLVIASLSFVFSSLPNPRARSGLLEQIKQLLTKISIQQNVSIIITSQLATKTLKSDGSYGSFEEGAKAVMLPQLGNSYLSPGRSHRILLTQDSPVSGSFLYLPDDWAPGSMDKDKPIMREPYDLIGASVTDATTE